MASNPDSGNGINRRRLVIGALVATAGAAGARTGWLVAQDLDEDNKTSPTPPIAEATPAPEPKDFVDEERIKDFLIPESYKSYRDNALKTIYSKLTEIYDAYPDNKLSDVYAAKYHQLETAKQTVDKALFLKTNPDIDDLVLGIALTNPQSNLCVFSPEATEKLLNRISMIAPNPKAPTLDWDESNISQKLSDPINNLTATYFYLTGLITLYGDPGLAILAFLVGEGGVNDALEDAKRGRDDLSKNSKSDKPTLVTVIYNNDQIDAVYKVFAGAIIARRERTTLLRIIRKN